VFLEPSRTPYDLNFHVLGIPVRVHPFFWVVALLFGMGGSPEPGSILIWVGVVFVSVLVHELGHALTARYFGCQPWITLYGFGGLASFRPTFPGAAKHILILLAGPGAGFGLAALVMAAVHFTGNAIRFFNFEIGSGNYIANERLYELTFYLLYVNIFWGIINLFPVFPLDGGQIARQVLVSLNPWQGMRQSLWLSVLTGALLAAFGLLSGQPYLALFFGFLAFSSYQAVRGPTRGGW
jgi:stage IV sporulation protein FB